MKKLYATRIASNLKYFRFSLVNVFLSAAVIVLLSSVFPVFAGNFDLVEQFLQSMKNATAVYSQANDRSIVSAYDNHDSDVDLYDNPSSSKARYLTALNRLGASFANDSDYVNFLVKMFFEKSEKSKSNTDILTADSNLVRNGMYDIGQTINELPIAFQRSVGLNLVNRDLEKGQDSLKAIDINVNYSGFRAPEAQFGGAIAIGSGAKVRKVGGEGEFSSAVVAIAIGVNATVENGGSIAFGEKARALNNGAIAVGSNAVSSGMSAVTIGVSSSVSGIHSVAIGNGVQVSGDDAFALGPFSEAKANNATAIGYKASASALNAFAFGRDAEATGNSATAIGYKASASALNAFAFGNRAEASAEGAFAFGAGAKAVDPNSIVFGTGAGASGSSSIAVGHEANAKGEDAISIGHGASIVEQSKQAIAIGANATVSQGNLGDGSNGLGAIAIGANASTDGRGAFALGFDAYSSINGIAVGSSSYSMSGSVAIGHKAKVTGSGSVAIGSEASTQSINVVVVGERAHASDRDAVVIGSQAKAESKSAVAVGFGASVTVEDGIAIGYRSNSVTASGVVGYGYIEPDDLGLGRTEKDVSISPVWQSTKGAFSVGQFKKDGTLIASRQITGVAAGTQDYDAVNVAQLKALEKTGWKLSVDGSDKGDVGLGLQSGVDFSSEDGNVKINHSGGGEDAKNKLDFTLSDDLKLKDMSAESISAKLITSDGFKSGDVVFNATGLAIGQNGPKVTAAGFDAANKKITNVEAGTEATDAVNFAQLQEVKQQVASNGFVKQDSSTKIITIGADTDGDKIDITNKSEGLRILSGINGGKISENSTEAITGGQVYSMQSTLATYFGGGAGYNEEGEWTAPTFKVKIVKNDGSSEEKSYDNVAEAFTEVGNSLTNVNNDITTIKNDITTVKNDITSVKNDITTQINNEINNVKGDFLVRQDEETHVITIGKGVEGDEISIANSGDEDRTLSGVKAATQGNEAVNKDQLDKGLADLSDSLQSGNSAVVLYDKKKDDENGAIDYTSVTFGGQDNEAVGLHNVANGEIAKDSRDAITGDQINTISQDVAKFLGGSASFENGTFTAPTYKISQINADGSSKKNTHHDVGSAFEDLDTSVSNVNSHLTETIEEFNQKITNINQEVKGDALLWSESENAFVAQHMVGNEMIDRKITHLADGDIGENSTDAINGGQVYSMQSTLATYFGGGAGYNEEGEWTAPTFKVKIVKNDGSSEEKSYDNVAEAFTEVGNSLTNVNNDITTVKNDITSVKNDITTQINNEINNVKGDFLVRQDETTHVITIGKEVEGGEISIANSSDGDRTLSGVKAAEKGNEAVNKDQFDQGLKDLSSSLQSGDSAVVLYDKKKGGAIDYTSVTFGGKNKEAVGLHNVADGKIAEGSRDAITGGQINTISQEVAQFLGGNTLFENGTFTAPTYNLSQINADGSSEEKTHNDVGSAFEDLDTSIKNVNQRIENISQGVAQDSLLWSESDSAFIAQHMVGDEKTDSKITHLADGDIGENSTDAINGGQVYSMQSTLATYFGGGAGYNEEGEWTAPTFKVKIVKNDGSSEEKSYDNVAEAFTEVGNSLTNVNNDITTVKNDITSVKNDITTQINNEINNVKGDFLVKQDEETHAITIGKEVEGDGINIANSSNGDRTISGVKAATQDNEAVNKGQFDQGLKDLSDSLQSGNSAVVLYDKKKDDENGAIDYTSVTFGGQDNEAVGLHNVANGEIAKDSRDAITGDQINTISQDVAKFLGGSASFENGTFTAPTYKISQINADGSSKKNTHHDVGSAFEDLDTSVSNVNSHLTETIEEFNQKITNINQEIKGDALLWNESENAFVAQHMVGNEMIDRKITHLADGDIGENSTDAINGGQVYSMQSTLATYFGGDAGYNEEGEWTAPTFKVKIVKNDGTSEETSYDNVAEAFTEVGNSITNVNDNITTVKNELTSQINSEISNMKGDLLVKQDETTHVITIGKEVEGGEISIANSSDGDRTLSGVKAAEKGNEAVNKDQFDQGLKDLSSSLQSGDSAVVLYDKKKGGAIDYTSVTFGGKNKEAVGLHNVADGKIAEGSRDAITGGQINTISQEVAQFLGGNTLFENGTFTAPTYNLSQINADGSSEEKTHNDVGSAFEDLDTSIKNVNQRIENISQGVAQDSLLWSESDSAFTAQHMVGDEKTDSKITHLADGDIGENSTDAINGGQVYSMQSTLATYFGGGAGYNEEGEWTAPTFKVKVVKNDGSSEEKSYDNVAEAFTEVGNSITNVNDNISTVKNELTTQINNEINNVKGDFLVKQDEETHVITIGKEVEGDGINIANSSNEDRTISGVKAATQGNEAVNKDQLDKGLADLSDSLQSGNSAVVLYDKKKDDENGAIDYTSVTFGGQDNEAVGLHNVANGEIAKDSRDAITGDQINTISQDVAKFLGGSASFENGTFTAPTYKISQINADGSSKKNTHHDVGSAFEDLDTSVSNVNSHLTETIEEFNQKITNINQEIKGDALLWNESENAFVAQHMVGNEMIDRKITHLADGDIGENSTDAINGGQVYSMQSTLATYFGGDAGYNEEGEWTAPTFKVKIVKNDGTSEETSYDNVAEAFTEVGNSITNVNDNITTVKNELTSQINSEISNMKGDLLVKQDETTHAITIGKEVEGDEISIANSSNADRTISGVKAATQDNEAVNKGQFDQGLKDLSDSLQSGDSAVVLYDKKRGGAIDYTSVTFGGKNKEAVGLHNVADGKIAEGSRDAITGGQINTISQEVAQFLGGNTLFENGTFTAPTYNLSQINADGSSEEKTHNDVGSAFEDLDTSIKNVNQRIENISQGVAQDSLLWSESDSAFIAQHMVGDEKTDSKITHLADGDIGENSTDAINGGQVYSMQSTLATYFGGGAGYNEEGEWTAPTFKVKVVKNDGSSEEKSYDNVAEAFTEVGNSITNVNDNISTVKNELTTQINNEINNVKGDFLVKQDEETHVITIGKEVEGDGINIANSSNEDRTISGVKAATQGNEAVNKDQLDKGLADLSDSLQSGNSAVVLYDKKKDDENGAIDYTSVTFGGQDNEAVGLHNVANGEIAKDSRDAITGDQINTISQDVAKFLGGSASFENGTFTAPTYKISQINADGSSKENTHNDVGSAFEDLDTSVSNVNNHLTETIEEFNQKITNINQEIKGDALLWSKSENAFVAKHGDDGEKTDSKITHLADGDIIKNSTDAINGGQVYSMQSTLATYFGGGAGYDAEGKWNAPTFKVKIVKNDGTSEETSYDDVAEAFAGVGNSITNVNNDINTVKNELTNQINSEISNMKGESLVKQDETTHVIAIGGEKNGTEITLTNIDGAARTLSGVKAGALSESSTDAVNGSQLYSMSNTFATYFGGGAGYDAEGKWNAPTFKVKIVKNDGTSEETSYDDVAEAFAGVGNSITNVNNDINTVKNELTNQINSEISNMKGESLVKQDETTHVIAIGGEKNGTEITLTNIDGAARTLSGVKAGALSESSTDAVNGSQLYSMSNTFATYFGGDAGYDAEGKWNAPTFKVETVKSDGTSEEISYDNVAEAFAGVGSSITNVKNELTNQINSEISNMKDESLVKQDETTHVIAIGGEKNGTEITLANIDGAARTLSGVKAGALSESSTDAVNGSQLYSMSNTFATYFGGDAGYDAEGKWNAPTFKVETVKSDGTSEEISYDNVAEAFAGVGNSITNVKNELTNQINSEISNVKDESLVKQDETTHVIAIGGEKNGTEITLANIDGAARTLSGVKAGALSESSTDAVNGSQLYFMSNQLAAYFGGGAGYKNGEWVSPTFTVMAFNTDGTATEVSHGNVSAAFDGVNGSMSSINDRIGDVEKNVASNGLNWNEAEGAYDGRHDGVDGKITHVADGKVEEGSKDAVNGGQLWETNQKVTEVENKVTAVEDKVNAIDQQVQGIAVTADGAVQYDKDDDGNRKNSITLIGGDESAPVLMDNVADGKIETGSKEAVNGGQLHDYTEQQMQIVLDDAKKYTDEHLTSAMENVLNDAQAYTDMKFEVLSQGIQDVRKEARQAAAIGLAVSNLRYHDTPGSLSLSFGTGIWRSQSAFAIGAGYTSEDGRIRSNISATSAGGHWGIGAGITLRMR
ncbi:Vomp family autotransporter [Bartonella sp. B23]